jgi:enoyl-CoA hydratase/carnithine racemase
VEADPDVTVVLFESANRDYFMAHWDLADAADIPPGPTGQLPFVDVLIRLSKLPVITVSSIRGRARGAGSEFLLATDVRFASRERALLGQFEIAAGLIPGGGGVSRLVRLVGRGRALEIMASGGDFDADTAERYGYVNRSIPDAKLDDFVEAFVNRVAAFRPSAIRELKQVVDSLTLPSDDEFTPQADAFFAGLARPDVQGWINRMFELTWQQDGEVERELAKHAVRP